MLSFTNYLYKDIGKRIKRFRKQHNLTQEKFIAKLQTLESNGVEFSTPIDRSTLSNIENGNLNNKKNPYLLSESQIKGIAMYMKCDSKELIFGNSAERERKARLFLLAAILNSEKNEDNEKTNYIIPFMNYVFETNNIRELVFYFNFYLGEDVEEKKRILKPTVGLDQESAENIGENIIKEWFKDKYPFFTSYENIEKYNNIVGEPDQNIEFISNLLIKLLAGNQKFAEFFSKKLRISLHSNRSKSNDFSVDLPSFNKNDGRYGEVLFGNKDGFHYFVNAFNDMWGRHKDIFTEYFECNMFYLANSMSHHKHLSNKLFHEIITSTDLSNILFSLIEEERFSMGTMDGHYILYRSMFEMTLEKIFI